MPGRIDRDDAVLVEQRRVPLEQHRQAELGFQLEVGSPVGQHIGLQAVRHEQDGSHPLTGFDVPPAGGRDPGLLPQALFHLVGARLVAPRDEPGRTAAHFPEGIRRGRRTLDPGRIRGGAGDDEIVVHDGTAVQSVAVAEELRLQLGIVHEQDVDIAVFTELEGLAGAYGDHVDPGAGRLFEDWQDVVQQPGVVRAGGGGQAEDRGIGRGAHDTRGRQQHKTSQNQPVSSSHGVSFGGAGIACGGRCGNRLEVDSRRHYSSPCGGQSTAG